jgi:hypothetical protein
MKTATGTDPTIETLGVVRHQEVEADPRWRDLALGALPAVQAEALRQAAPHLHEIHRPFDEAEHARLLDWVEARLAGKRRVAPARWRRGLLRAMATVAAAGAVALAFLHPGHDSLELAWSEPRSGGPHVSHLSSAPGARLTELIVPVRPVADPIAIRGALLLRPGGADPERARAWRAPLKLTQDNEIVLAGTRAELFPGMDSGDWDMVIVVGRPGPALAADELRELADRGSHGGLVVLKKRVVLDGPCVGSRSRPCRDPVL